MKPDFDGITYDPKRDSKRLHAQLDVVRDFMIDHADNWWTLGELAIAMEFPEASISARLRDMRKKKYGSHLIARQYAGSGLYVYRYGGRV